MRGSNAARASAAVAPAAVGAGVVPPEGHPGADAMYPPPSFAGRGSISTLNRKVGIPGS